MHNISNIYYIKNQLLLYEFYNSESSYYEVKNKEKKDFIDNSRLSPYKNMMVFEGSYDYFYQTYNSGDEYYNAKKDYSWQD